MREKMSHRYPYTVKTFVDNARERGLANAIREDWYITKENLKDTAYEAVLNSLVSLAVPVVAVVYITKKLISVTRHNLRRDYLDIL